MNTGLKVKIDVTDLEQAIEKANHLVRFLQEAQQISNSLKSQECNRHENYEDITKKLLCKQLELLTEKSEVTLSCQEVVSLSEAMNNLARCIINAI